MARMIHQRSIFVFYGILFEGTNTNDLGANNPSILSLIASLLLSNVFIWSDFT